MWRQCSEFAWANIVSSTSVGLRPLALEVREQVVDLVRGEGEAHRRVRLLDGGAAPAEDVDLGERLRGDVAEEGVGLVERRRAPSPSCGRGGGAGRPRGRPVALEVVGGAALDAAHEAGEAALARDVGGLRRPGRDRAEARRDEDHPPAERGRPAGPAGRSGAGGRASRAPRPRLALRLDEVPVLRGVHREPGRAARSAALSLSRRKSERAVPPGSLRIAMMGRFYRDALTRPASAGVALAG